jgi:serine/threonine protein kinase
MARIICQLLIDRAHVERADPKAVQNSLDKQLRRVFEAVGEGRPLCTVRVPDGAPQLMFLRAPYYDGCLFNPSARINTGGQGCFLVGMTPSKHAVAVKMMLRPEGARNDAMRSVEIERRKLFAYEAELTRYAARYDVLQHFNTERHQFTVMPLFSGDLKEHAAHFLSLHAPPGAMGWQNGLFGARYVLRRLVSEAVDLHHVRNIVHADIKADNIFLQRDRRRFVLGDLGIACVLGGDDQALSRGGTPNFAAPEQFGASRQITPKVDIFGLATTMFYLLTTQCSPVMAYRQQHFPNQSRSGLFAYQEDKPRLQDILTMHEVHRQMVFEALDGSRPPRTGQALTPQIRRYQEHINSIHSSVDHFDFSLGKLLRRMLQHDPAMRPDAAELGSIMDTGLKIDKDCVERAEAVWDAQIPWFGAAVGQKLEELSIAIDAIMPHAQRKVAA